MQILRWLAIETVNIGPDKLLQLLGVDPHGAPQPHGRNVSELHHSVGRTHADLQPLGHLVSGE